MINLLCRVARGMVKTVKDLDSLILVRTIGIVKYYHHTKTVRKWFFSHGVSRMNGKENYVHVRILGFEFDGLVKI